MKNWSLRDVVDFETVGHVSDAISRTLILVRDEAYLVSPFDETLGQLITVGFNASEFRKSKIRADEYFVALIIGFGWDI